MVSKLELAARQTSVVWAMLHEQKVKPPPPSGWPTGVTPPGLTKSTNPPSSVLSKKSSESDAPEVRFGRCLESCTRLNAAYRCSRRLTCNLSSMHQPDPGDPASFLTLYATLSRSTIDHL